MISAIAKFFVQGGEFMWVILLVLAAGIAVTIERAWFYFRVCRADGNLLVAGIARDLAGNDAAAAEKNCQGHSPLHVLLRTALRRYTAGLALKDIRQGVDETAILELPRYSERLSYLALLANIATLLGLMGTIFGLISSFSSLSVAEASQKATLLAQGISVAMNTTAFGLIVAIPCMVASTYFTNKQVALLAELDSAVLKTLNLMEKIRA